MTRWLAALAAVLLGTATALAQTSPGPVIEPGSSVDIEYTLQEDGGPVIESSKGRGPITYTQGNQQLIPGLERAMLGLRAGDQKRVLVKPEEGYGPVDPTALTEVSKTLLPADALSVGTVLMAKGADGDSRPVRVKEVKDSTVVLDLNHPLAGKTLVFDVRVLAVTAPGASKPPK